MTSDLSFVADSAQTDTYIFLMKCFCYRFRNGSLTGSRRSYQTQDRTLTARCQFTYCKEFHDTFLHIFQTVVTFFQDLPRLFKISGIFRFLIPRKSQKCLDISTQNTAFCRSIIHTLKSVDFFIQLVFYFLRCIQCFRFLSVFFRRICSILLTEFFPDQLQLFSENVITLIFVYTCL